MAVWVKEGTMSDVGLRKGGERRRQDRRGLTRDGKERRRGDRRGAVGGLLMTGLALAGALHHTRGPASPSEPISMTQRVPEAAATPPQPKTPFEGIIEEASKKFGVNADLIRAVIQTESRFDPKARSRAGAMGLMQIMPILARELEVKNPFDPRENVFAGVKYLSQMLERHSGNVPLALASYNAGPRNVARYRGVPPFKETRNYVKKIQTLVADADTSGETGGATGVAD